MLIHDRAEREKATTERMQTLLHFLKEETYSDYVTLRRVLGFSPTAHSPLYKLLDRAIQAGFIVKYTVPGARQKIILWGITLQGLANVILQSDLVFPAHFEPGKLRLNTLDHHLMNQQVRLILQEKGGQQWCHGDRGEFRRRYPTVQHRPDGVITLQSGAIVAIETERTLKTRARYINIISSHLAASDAGQWHYTVYVMPNDAVKTSLIKLFDSINFVTRKHVPVKFDAHQREMFLFRTLAELEQLSSH